MANELSSRKQKKGLNNTSKSMKKEHRKEIKTGKKLNQRKSPRIPKA